jgi:hypothetical protein
MTEEIGGSVLIYVLTRAFFLVCFGNCTYEKRRGLESNLRHTFTRFGHPKDDPTEDRLELAALRRFNSNCLYAARLDDKKPK